jgi:hypothetical protein
MFENVSGMAAERLVGKRRRRSWAAGAEALLQIERSVVKTGPMTWANAYNDVHCSGSSANVDRTPRAAFNRPI